MPKGTRGNVSSESKKLVRFQVEVTPEESQEMLEFASLGGARTQKEFFNIARTLLIWAIREKQNQAEIFSRRDQAGPIRELVIPYLENVAANARRKNLELDGPISQD